MELQKKNSQDLTISAKALQTTWQDLRVTIATTELEAAKSPKLRELAAQVGADTVVMLIKGQLAGFIAFSGCDWSPEASRGVIEQIKCHYGHLTISQWKLFFEKAKAGKFAQEGMRDSQTMIARITPLIFMQWLATHAARCEEANEIEYARRQYEVENQNLSEDSNKNYVSAEVMKSAFEKLTAEWEKNKDNESAEKEEMRRKVLETEMRRIQEYAKGKGVDVDKIAKIFGRNSREDKP